MLPGVPQERIDKLLATTLQFNPDYYRIVNLQEEESKDEKYGFEAQGSSEPSRKNT